MVLENFEVHDIGCLSGGKAFIDSAAEFLKNNVSILERYGPNRDIASGNGG